MMLEQCWHDLERAWRGLWRARGFGVTAVLTLAVGIAGTTAMFALIQGVLLRPLPVRDQDSLVVAWKALPTSGYAHYPFGPAEIDNVGRASALVRDVAGVTSNGAGRSVMIEDGASSYVRVGLVTGGFFEVLGVEPVLGRAFTRADDLAGAANALVISHGLWQRRYGGRPGVIGHHVRLNERPFTIVGVMPPDLDYPRGAEVWQTAQSVPADGPFGDAARQEIDLIARLEPGATLEQARIELTALMRRFEAEPQDDPSRKAPRGLIPIVRSFEEVVVGDVRPALLVLFASVLLVLLIASANVANLLLMRGEARRSELAMRAALGAARSRIVREVFAESLMLALAAGVVGLAVTWWTLHTLIALVPDGLPRMASVHIDVRVVLFTIVTAFVTALVAGAVPAISSTRHDLVSLLRSGGTGMSGTASPLRRLRRWLLIVQVALAVTTVAAAGLLARSLLQLHSIDLGLAADHLVFVDLSLPQAKYAERVRHAQFLDDVMARLEALPGIEAATPVNVLPFAGEGGWDVPRFTAEGQTADRAALNPALNLESIHPSYFETFDVPIVRGRAFTKADRKGMADAAIVSEDVAARTWPGEDPIGKRLKAGGPQSRDPWYTIVGIAASTRYRELTKPRPTLYLAAAQFQMTAQMLVLRTTLPAERAASLAREAVRDVDSDVRVLRVAPFTELLRAPLERPRFNAFLLVLFGIAALLLSTVGAYGVMASSVRQRHREIAIRIALGATTASVQRLVVGEALRLGGAGVLLGLTATAITTHLLRGLLFGVHPLDPASLAGAALLVLFVSVMASVVPAREATRRRASASFLSRDLHE